MEDKTYFRRCHHCDSVNECEHSGLERCQHCTRPLAPFYYFDEQNVAALTDTGLSRESHPVSDSYYQPLRGLSTYW